MKMAKWVLKDNDAGTVLVVRTDSPVDFGRMLLFDDKKIKFYLLTDKTTSKALGYRLDYLDKKRPRSSSFNSFTYMSPGRPLKNPKDMDLEILYEDQVVRLLLYESPSKHKDYILIGRWRQENLEDLDTEEFIKEENE